MSSSPLKLLLVGTVLVITTIGPAATAALLEPEKDAGFRDLRSDYVKQWYIYNDSRLDGILNPGDTMITTFNNWWTPVSAHSQHNYTDGSTNPYGGSFTYAEYEDRPSAPMNFASKTTSSANYWLPMAKDEVHFYMTYSQFDNNDFGTYYDNGFGSFTQDQRDMWKQRNMERNGYAMGWVSNYIEKDADGNYQHNIGAGGEVAMDIYVHNGEAEIDVEFGTDGVGTSRSNPQVSVSNDISRFSKEGETFHPPTFDETTQSYDSTANAAYKAAINDGSAITDAQFGVVVNSMEISEVDPFALTAADVIWGDKTPTEIKNGAAKDHDGNDYIYADAFLDRSQYDLSTSDGGVIAGLAGQSSYDPEINNFGDQQVIRIDLPQSVLNSIDAIVFYDFGDSIVGAAGTQQTAPVAIRFDIIDGNLLYKVDPQDESTWVYFPENRIYIARVRDMVPEPTSLVLLALGSTMIMARRTRRRR